MVFQMGFVSTNFIYIFAILKKTSTNAKNEDKFQR